MQNAFTVNGIRSSCDILNNNKESTFECLYHIIVESHFSAVSLLLLLSFAQFPQFIQAIVYKILHCLLTTFWRIF